MILFYTIWLISFCILHFPKYPFYFPRKESYPKWRDREGEKEIQDPERGRGTDIYNPGEKREKSPRPWEREREREREKEREREVATSLTCLLFLPFPWSPLLLPEGLVCWDDSAGGEGAPSTFKDMYWVQRHVLGIYLCNLPSGSQRISNVLRRVRSWRVRFIYYAPWHS